MIAFNSIGKLIMSSEYLRFENS